MIGALRKLQLMAAAVVIVATVIVPEVWEAVRK